MSVPPVALGILVSSLHMGGAEQLLLEFLRRIDRTRYAPHLFLLGELGPIGQEIAALGLPYTAHLGGKPYDLRVVWRLRSQFRAQGIQALMLINHRNALAFGVPAAWLAGINCVVNWENETFKRYRGHELFMTARRFLMPGVHAVVAAAEGHADYIIDEEKVPARKVVAIPNGVDPARFAATLTPTEAKQRLGIPAERKTVGILAVLRPDKNHDMFLQAAAKVVEKGVDAHFCIIGDGPRRQALEELSASLGLGDRVSFLGFRRDLADIFAALALACLASHPQQETLSVGALEVMSTGVPMVVTRVGFMSEIVIPGQTGLLVEPGDMQGFADALSSLLLDDATRKRMGEQAKFLVAEHYHLDGMTRQFEALFDDVLAHVPPRKPRLSLSRARIALMVSWQEKGEWDLLRSLRGRLAKVDVICPSPGLASSRLRRGLPLFTALSAWLSAWRYDVLVSWSTPYAVCLGLLLRFLPKRIRPIHLCRDFHLDPTRQDLSYRLRRCLLKMALPAMDMLWCTSSKECQVYGQELGLPPERLAFFPDDPPKQFLCRPYTEPGEYVFAYGNSDRDYDVLLKAARALPYEVRILTQAYALDGQLPVNVRVLRHRVSEEELATLIEGSMGVVVSTKDHDVAAGQNVMLEAMCLARPVIASVNVATVEYSDDGDAALFFAIGDAQMLTEKLGWLGDHRQEAKAMGLRGRALAEKYLAELPQTFLRLIRPWVQPQ